MFVRILDTTYLLYQCLRIVCNLAFLQVCVIRAFLIFLKCTLFVVLKLYRHSTMISDLVYQTKRKTIQNHQAN